MERILLVDDEPLNLELLRAHLEPEGYELLEASRGEQAVDALAHTNIGLVLLDVRMPGIGGLEAARRIKRMVASRGEYVPVVLLTALNDWASRREGLEAGADDFLSKPFDPSELLLRIRNLLAQRADRVALREQNVRLVELQRFKEEMAALLVHDLKNPASAVLANIEFAMGCLPPGDTSELKEVLNDARDGCQRTLRLLTNLLDVARAEDNRLEVNRRSVSLAEVILPLVHAREAVVQARGVRFAVSLEPSFVAPIDPDLIGRIVENVLDNAVRYTPRGGYIQVATRVVNDGSVQVRIGNSGTPIPLEVRAQIFEKYGQLHSATREHANNGLGLYFCRLAAEAHGGRIWVEEEPDLPIVFVVSLPQVY